MVQTLVRNRFQRDREWSHVESEVASLKEFKSTGKEGGKVSKKKS